ncbi:tetratricopeptide repeat protein [Solimonas soli]|uniref:tetratricopeptide repeat protein n=1 Tax=Solimonas soli TaxID=413479 RepID=UPI000486A9C6|nr:tetratricopeptide repeat protein [Solimonas soli]
MRGLAIVSLLLAACSAAPTRELPGDLFADEGFGAPPPAIQQLDLFAASPAMQAFINGEVPKFIRTRGDSRGLYEAMRTSLRIDYDASTTRTAAETFAARSGNCLSLVILTSALARELGIPVRYQYVRNEQSWSRTGRLVLLNGHVNIALEPGQVAGKPRAFDPGIVIDFLPPSELRGQETVEIDEASVVAMYMNNRAVETMVTGDVDGAYWWARAALHKDPSFVAAYNTLGVIYRRHGDAALAERSFTLALQMEPDNAQLLSNMIGLLTGEARSDEAASFERRLASVQPIRPFEFLDAGYAAMAAGDPGSALILYRRELARQPYSPEVHYAIAVANARLGRDQEARKYLAQASTLATNVHDHDIYAAKLAKLEALHVN